MDYLGFPLVSSAGCAAPRRHSSRRHHWPWISSAEYARFLNTLSRAGQPNSHHGTYLLACEMPHERGGRLHPDRHTGAWAVSPGYEDYPVYWVTWVGAAAFAARNGARLPAQAAQAELTG